jgi:hypothetical protein
MCHLTLLHSLGHNSAAQCMHSTHIFPGLKGPSKSAANCCRFSRLCSWPSCSPSCGTAAVGVCGRSAASSLSSSVLSLSAPHPCIGTVSLPQACHRFTDTSVRGSWLSSPFECRDRWFGLLLLSPLSSLTLLTAQSCTVPSSNWTDTSLLGCVFCQCLKSSRRRRSFPVRPATCTDTPPRAANGMSALAVWPALSAAPGYTAVPREIVTATRMSCPYMYRYTAVKKKRRKW